MEQEWAHEQDVASRGSAGHERAERLGADGIRTEHPRSVTAGKHGERTRFPIGRIEMDPEGEQPSEGGLTRLRYDVRNGYEPLRFERVLHDWPSDP